jgi:hypothetical protein
VILLSECNHMSFFRRVTSGFYPSICEMASEIIKPIILIQFTIVKPYLPYNFVIHAPIQHTLILNSTSLHTALQLPISILNPKS